MLCISYINRNKYIHIYIYNSLLLPSPSSSYLNLFEPSDDEKLKHFECHPNLRKNLRHCIKYDGGYIISIGFGIKIKYAVNLGVTSRKVYNFPAPSESK
jgi:hypothetical protein